MVFPKFFDTSDGKSTFTSTNEINSVVGQLKIRTRVYETPSRMNQIITSNLKQYCIK